MRPSLSKLLGVVTISRRSAAGSWLRCRAAAGKACRANVGERMACTLCKLVRAAVGPSCEPKARLHCCRHVSGTGRASNGRRRPTGRGRRAADIGRVRATERLRLRNSDELLTCFSKETAFGAPNFLRLRRAYRGFAFGTVLSGPEWATHDVTIIPVTPTGGVKTPGGARAVGLAPV